MAQCTKKYTGKAWNTYWGEFNNASGCISKYYSVSHTSDGDKSESGYHAGFSITIGDGNYIRPYSTMCKWFIKYA